MNKNIQMRKWGCTIVCIIVIALAGYSIADHEGAGISSELLHSERFRRMPGDISAVLY